MIVLVKAILSGVPDERIVDTHTVIPSPLRDLIRGYNKLALNDPLLAEITESTTGKELKSLVVRLRPEDQIQLLYHYSQAVKSLHSPDVYAHDSTEVEQRKIALLLKHILAAMIVMFVFFLLGSAAAVAVFTGALQDVLSTHVVTSMSEIIRFIFAPGRVAK